MRQRAHPPSVGTGRVFFHHRRRALQRPGRKPSARLGKACHGHTPRQSRQYRVSPWAFQLDHQPEPIWITASYQETLRQAKARAQEAALATVPYWVREMTDDEAYMALLLTNTQSELHPLEEAFHALHSELNGSEYARQVGKSQATISVRLCAARVAMAVTTRVVTLNMLIPIYRSLTEIHAVPPWLWTALVTKLLAEKWTVEKTQEHVKRVQKVEAPPLWADRETISPSSL